MTVQKADWLTQTRRTTQGSTINQSIDQSINGSVTQWINRSDGQPLDQSINRSINWSITLVKSNLRHERNTPRRAHRNTLRTLQSQRSAGRYPGRMTRWTATIAAGRLRTAIVHELLDLTSISWTHMSHVGKVRRPRNQLWSSIHGPTIKKNTKPLRYY